MEWTEKDQAVFECADKGIMMLKRLGWITRAELDKIEAIIQEGIDRER